jgi:secondary thiamine-phosphate synthase enzyme
MSVYHDELTIHTQREGEIIDLTDEVEKLVHSSHIQDGLACIFVPGSTGAVTTMEYERGLLKDIPRALERLAPKNMPYDHHETWHDDNGRSHVRASILGPSLTVPVHDGHLIHGTWQQLVFIELDTQPRTRKLVVHIIGE